MMNTPTLSEPKAPAISPLLIYEEIDGKPLYYRGYRDVLNHQKTLDDIMGSSSLQSVIIKVLLKYLYAYVDGADYEVFTNETGLHLAKGNNLASDIAIYETTTLQDYQYDEHYFGLPPKTVIEVDIKIDLTQLSQEAYIKEKTEKLFKFGVEKVIWILSTAQQVILAEPNQDWLIRNWHLPFAVVENHAVNIGKMLQESGANRKSQ